MKELNLTNSSLVALVDDADFEFLRQFPWNLSTKGYAQVRLNHKKSGYPSGMWQMHELINYVHGLAVIGKETNHKDRNKLNNQKFNLEQVTKQENLYHRGPRKSNTSGHQCIWQQGHPPRWRVQLIRCGKTIHLGLFASLEDAISTRDEFLRKFAENGMVLPAQTKLA